MTTPSDPVAKLVAGRTIETIAPQASTADAARRMTRGHVGSLVVLEGSTPVGIVTDRDLALGVLAHGRVAEECQVRELMTSPVVTLPATATLVDATRVMRRQGVRRLPLVDDGGELVGLVAADDLHIALGERLLKASRAIRTEWQNEAAPPERSSLLGKE